MEEMNNPPTNEMDDLIIRALRGQLTEAEARDFQRRLQNNQALREAYAFEQGLEKALEHLPNVPISSNFTSLVLQKVRAEQPRSLTEQRGWMRYRFARLATGLAAATIAGVLSIHHYRRAEQQEMMARVTGFTEVASALSSEQAPNLLLQDFEAIKRLAVPAESELDLELLVALQK